MQSPLGLKRKLYSPRHNKSPCWPMPCDLNLDLMSSFLFPKALWPPRSSRILCWTASWGGLCNEQSSAEQQEMRGLHRPVECAFLGTWSTLVQVLVQTLACYRGLIWREPGPDSAKVGMRSGREGEKRRENGTLGSIHLLPLALLEHAKC